MQEIIKQQASFLTANWKGRFIDDYEDRHPAWLSVTQGKKSPVINIFCDGIFIRTNQLTKHIEKSDVRAENLYGFYSLRTFEKITPLELTECRRNIYIMPEALLPYVPKDSPSTCLQTADFGNLCTVISNHCEGTPNPQLVIQEGGIFGYSKAFGGEATLLINLPFLPNNIIIKTYMANIIAALKECMRYPQIYLAPGRWSAQSRDYVLCFSYDGLENCVIITENFRF